MSRRAQIAMSEGEIRSFVGASKTMTLVSNGQGGFPHPMPMWFVYDDDGSIRMTTFAKSQKVQNLRRDPRVALMVEAGEEYAQLRGVVFYGNAELIEDSERIADTLLEAAGNDLSVLDGEALGKLRGAVAPQASKRVLLRVKPDRIVSWDHSKLGGVY